MMASITICAGASSCIPSASVSRAPGLGGRGSGDLTFLRQPRHSRLYLAARLGQRRRARVMQDHLESGRQCRLRDARAHRTGADDAYGVERLRHDLTSNAP